MRKLRNLDDILDITDNYLKKLKNDDRVCIIHHDDTDGCSSAAMIYVLINHLTNNVPIIFPIRGTNNVNRQLINSLKTIHPDLVISLDLPLDSKKLNVFRGFILDHHVYNVNEQREDMIYLNPRFFEKNDEMVVPTSYITYRILKRLLPSEKMSWVSGMGITEDHRVDICREVFEDVKQEYPELLKIDVINQKAVEKSIFGEMWDMVKAGRMMNRVEGARIAVMALVECKNRPDQFLNGLTENSYKLKKYYNNLVNEIQVFMEDLEKGGRFFQGKKVIIYEPKSSKISGLTSFLSDKIRQKYPEWIVCVVNKDLKYGKVKISIRLEQSKRKADLVDILEKIGTNIRSLRGGGHRSAVGAQVDLDDYDEFFEEFLTSIK